MRTSGRPSGAISGPPGDKYTFEQLPEAIEALQNGDDIDYEGASGPIDLDENGDPTAGVYDINEFQRRAELIPVESRFRSAACAE